MASKSILTPTIEEQRVTRIAWVTGAGKGIGRQVSLELAKEGWLVAASARTISDLSSLVREAHPLQGSIREFAVDVTDAPLDFKSFLPRIAQPFIRKFLNVNL